MSTSTGTVRLVPADLAAHRPALLELNVAYLTWLEQVSEELFGIRLRGLIGADVRTYTEGSLDAMVTEAQRHGSYYLVEVAAASVGMGGLRRFADGVAEVKRMYVRPDHRGRRLGATVLAKLVDDGRSLGYEEARLDTGKFMTAAHRTYGAAGFVDRGPSHTSAPPASRPRDASSASLAARASGTDGSVHPHIGHPVTRSTPWSTAGPRRRR